MAIYYIDLYNGNDSNSGTSWASAWKTVTNGATAARLVPADEIRICKTPAPKSIGNATWTNGSKSIVLSNTGLTSIVTKCDTAFTAANGGAVALQTAGTYTKEGTANVRIQAAASAAINTLYAYQNITDADYSSYDSISLWFANSAVIATGNWKICLCSDSGATVVVDEFLIPAVPSTTNLIPFLILKNGGGNLGSNISSIGIYSGSVAPTNSSYIYLDNIIACNSNSLSLTSLVSKNSVEQGGSDFWYGIQNISGNTINIDNGVMTTTTQRGYSGTTETVETFIRETFKTTMVTANTTIVNSVTDGSLANTGNTIYSGGWNTGTTVQDGETFFDGQNGYGYGLSNTTVDGTIRFITIDKLNFVRYHTGIVPSVVNTYLIKNCRCLNNSSVGINPTTSMFVTIKDCESNNNVNDGIFGQSTFFVDIINLKSFNNARYGINISYSDSYRLYDCITANNSLGVGGAMGNNVVAYRMRINDTNEVSVSLWASNFRSQEHDNTPNNHWIFSAGTTVNSQITERHSNTGVAWRCYCTSPTQRGINAPLEFQLGKIYCEPNSSRIVSVWCKKSHATNIFASLVVKPYQISDITTPLSVTKANDTNWEQLSLSIPTSVGGVIEIYAISYYLAGNAYTYWDDMTVK